MPTDFLSSLAYQVVGVVIVLGSLGFLAIAVSLIGSLLQLSGVGAEIPKEKFAPAAPAPVPGVSSQTDEIPAEVRAVIAAAVAATLDSSHHIVDITTATEVRLQAWSLEGRRQIFDSHSVR